jgi:hypothetical protein
MPKEVAVRHAEAESDHIEVGQRGAQRANGPDPFGDLGPVEARPDGHGGDSVREG